MKKQMLLNSDSYDFFLKETRKAEKDFFRYAELCQEEICKITDMLEDTSDLSNLRRINIKKFKEAEVAGKKFQTISKKFITEMEMMKDLAGNIFDPDLNIDEAKRFELHENYLASIDKSISLQDNVAKLISMEMEALKAFETGKHNETDNGDDEDTWNDSYRGADYE